VTTNPDPFQALRDELAAVAHDLRDSGKFMRAAVEHLVESEEQIVKVNRLLQIMVERIDRAVDAAIKIDDQQGGS
jgi:hypothetical protein